MTFEVEDVLSQLTQVEKISFLDGGNTYNGYWHTADVPRLEIPALRTSDGPNGQKHFNSTPTAAIPVGTALGSTWDKQLIFEVGKFLDLEARAKGVHVLLAPTINIQRIPNGGRGFESYSEDPVLSGKIAAAYVNGVQEDGLAACLKHFIGNDQEKERFSSNSIISERALREIYLKPFEITVRESNPKTIMTSYNRVNGVHVSEDPRLVDGILRKEWGWDGLVMSDWTGTYSTEGSINAGMDLSMPGPDRFKGAARVNHALFSKKISQQTLTTRARNLLNLIKSVESAAIPENAPEGQRDTSEAREFLRKLAGQAVVLLKNENKALPFKKTKGTLVIGPNATYAAYSGGGSALATPYYTVSPLEAVKSKIGADNVTYELGAYNHRYLPSIASQLFIDNACEENGTLIEIYNEKPGTPGRKPFDAVPYKDIRYFRMNDYQHPEKKSQEFYATLTSTFIPDFDGVYEFGISVFGTANLYIDNELIIDNTNGQELSDSFYGLGTVEKKGKFEVTKGKHYKLRIEFGSGPTSYLARNANSTFFGGGGLRFGAIHVIPDEEAIKRAVEQASKFDQVVIFTGLNADYESEGADRKDLKIPGLSNRLIAEVNKVNKNTVVVVQSGTPVEMPWAAEVSSLIWSSFGGNDTGNGLADVIFGDVNPSGKLPITFPIRFEDTPSYINNTTDNGRVLYGEDIYVGYRYYEKTGREVLFPFGYGLSYTDFELSLLSTNVEGKTLHVQIQVGNVGEFSGFATLQVYVGSKNHKFSRPVKELKDFDKVHLKKGQSKDVLFELDLFESTSYFDEEKNIWCSDKGDYFVFVGQSSDDKKGLVSDFIVDESKEWLGTIVKQGN